MQISKIYDSTGPSTWYKKPYFWGVGPWTIPFRHWDYEKFSFENKDPAECKADFRFEKNDISLLVDVLQTPDTFTCPNGTVCDSTEGLCVILKRFSYPCRLSDMISTFGRSVPELSVISNEVTEWMYNVHGHRITEWNHFIMSPNLLQNLLLSNS